MLIVCFLCSLYLIITTSFNPGQKLGRGNWYLHSTAPKSQGLERFLLTWSWSTGCKEHSQGLNPGEADTSAVPTHFSHSALYLRQFDLTEPRVGYRHQSHQMGIEENKGDLFFAHTCFCSHLASVFLTRNGAAGYLFLRGTEQ